ncbi:hypothetical protein L1987_39229 [Smallanthus sonchifolius]|uniref:Uncharacterized protein n=1 Tax=Smallanthus sonchifolius TaxID=185202 RepID=A0ACB9HKT4_9ASTR|nr:hypothetical protein L1987_39229 [Smallanthus sonchifolius]
MLQQAALPQSTQGMQVSFAPPPQATLPQSQRVCPSPPNQGQHGYMPRQRPSQLSVVNRTDYCTVLSVRYCTDRSIYWSSRFPVKLINKHLHA